MSHLLKYGEFEKRFRLDNGMLLASDELHNHEILRRVGRNAAVGTDFELICTDGIWMTQVPSQAKPLRVRAGGNANDVDGGLGARAVLIRGMNELGERISEVIPTNGVDASVETSALFTRLHEFLVIDTGTPYDALLTPSAGDLVLEDTAGETWAKIGVEEGRFLCGNFTVPSGHVAYLTEFTVFGGSDRGTDFAVHTIQGTLNEVAPFSPRLLGLQLDGIKGAFRAVLSEIVELSPMTEIQFSARVRSGMPGPASVFVGFVLNELLVGAN